MSGGARRSGGEPDRRRDRLPAPRDRRSAGEERSISKHEAPMPLMAERRMAPGMGAQFSGQAFTDAQLLNDFPKKMFTGRCRLFVGNLSMDLKEDELKELFTPHGDIAECYLSGKGFAFLRLDTRAHAESAKEALDGKMIKGRQIRVRYAVHGATIKVKELSPVVSNEMLLLAFSAFGDVERAIHIVDEKGKPTGEGIVEFERKIPAQEAMAQIRERVFLMTANSRPLQAEFLEPKDEEDGLSEKMIQKTHHLIKERELGPRFATMNSFEYMYGRRWKELYEYEKKRRAELEAELREQRRRLDADMEVEYEDYKAQILREELQRRQEELEHLEAARLQRRQQQQLMGGGGPIAGGWEPHLVDGPMGRNLPPTFGPGGARPPMPSLGIPPPGLPGHHPLGLLRGDREYVGGGALQNGRGSPQGPDVRKLLQGFRDSPHPNRHPQQLPPGLAGLLERNQLGLGGAFGSAGGSEGPPPGPAGGGHPLPLHGLGVRMPPPPFPMGAHPPPLIGGGAGGTGSDFPPDKKPRH